MSRAQVADLHALQRLDSEIERVAAEADAARRALAADPTAPARAASAASARAAEASAGRMRATEATLEETRARLQRQEARLFGGQVGAKDAGRAQDEIAHLRTLIATQEEAVLAAMLEAEEAQAAAEARGRALAEAERAREHDRADQSARLERVGGQLEGLRAERGGRAAAIAPELLARYEAIRRGHGGRAVVEVRGGVCQGCRVALTSAALQRARLASDLPLCDHCGRILYIP